ncbi:3-phosphoserine/phosphohydroxythreonine transaminase [Bacillus sp. FJAT-42376]|uniref:3-phosphoserine/phosphohydroxythreonine transaminase n=1 Tax=Bacillus sp. FJAT-42376 TaxID=2014076 RepID=UPI000F500AE9|nr:3-phosphoserine/phosphohydroxythreonine transaminase [Bacillus sp. FJAT-42376]AZB42242.1 3-phosphoserine/phosphohydroxythreonine transaminase [Bacillus sp. FJAT-42376]
MVRALNFSAGPAALPISVLEKAQKEFINFQGTGMSIMEMSHRGKHYEAVHAEAKSRLKKLMDVPDTHDILFLQGGASLQFSMVPLNFLKKQETAGYILTGSWSEKALKEAEKIGQTKVIASSKANQYRSIPSRSEWEGEDGVSYVHITSNNTIYGTQWHEFPDTDAPLVADMSSDILSRPVDISKFGLIYGGAQKNLGPSGVTVVIADKQWLSGSTNSLSKFLDYNTHASTDSLYNTPPTFAIYMLGLVLEWAESQGGTAGLKKKNSEKASLLYDSIAGSEGFYRGHAEKGSESHMNITFTLPDKELEKDFLLKAAEKGFIGLNGHRSIGGCRASIYNAVPLEACEKLADFMNAYRKNHPARSFTFQ